MKLHILWLMGNYGKHKEKGVLLCTKRKKIIIRLLVAALVLCAMIAVLRPIMLVPFAKVTIHYKTDGGIASTQLEGIGSCHHLVDTERKAFGLESVHARGLRLRLRPRTGGYDWEHHLLCFSG